MTTEPLDDDQENKEDSQETMETEFDDVWERI